MKIYIASSWKNQHAVEMLTAQLRSMNHQVVSWVENNYEEGYTATGATDFEKWVKTDSAELAFSFDTNGAAECDLFIYVGPAGKDAAAECGICYGQKYGNRPIPMLALYAKGEDFGLMRKMFDGWYDRYTDILKAVEKYGQPKNEKDVAGESLKASPDVKLKEIEYAKVKSLDSIYSYLRSYIIKTEKPGVELEKLINGLDHISVLAKEGIQLEMMKLPAEDSFDAQDSRIQSRGEHINHLDDLYENAKECVYSLGAEKLAGGRLLNLLQRMRDMAIPEETVNHGH